MTLLVTGQDVLQLPMSIADTVPIMERVFRLAGEGKTNSPARYRLPLKEGFLQFGPAALPSEGIVGFKLWANFGSKRREGWNYLFSLETGELMCIMHSFTIGRYRTSATTATAVKHLSPADASSVGIYGAGKQAEAQLEAIKAVRPIERVIVHSRTPEKRDAFCRKMAERLGIEVVGTDSAEAPAQGTDIVVTVTNAETPILKGAWIDGPRLVVSLGANHWYKREIDGDVIENAALIVVDEKEQAKVEGGNLLWAAAHGQLLWDQVEEMGDVIVGRVPVPQEAGRYTLFASHGLAIEDMAIAARTYELAKRHGIGREITL